MNDDTLRTMDDVYLRRVRDPNPLLQDLARQACDTWWALAPAHRTFGALLGQARFLGVPFDYVLDEVERRERAERRG